MGSECYVSTYAREGRDSARMRYSRFLSVLGSFPREFGSASGLDNFSEDILRLKAVRDDRQESPNALFLSPLSLLSGDRSRS